MERRQPASQEIDRFFRDRIDTVPHLEALLLLWESRPREWTEAELSDRPFVPPDLVRRVLRDLAAEGLIHGGDGLYAYSASPERDALVEAVAETYRREFARAFEFGRKKE